MLSDTKESRLGCLLGGNATFYRLQSRNEKENRNTVARCRGSREAFIIFGTNFKILSDVYARVEWDMIQREENIFGG